MTAGVGVNFSRLRLAASSIGIEAMTTLTIYGQWSIYNRDIKKVETRLDKFDIELCDAETWKAPQGFNVSTVKVNE